MSDHYDLIKNNHNDVITEIETAFWDIPFDNSDFQTQAFVIAAQVTPERAYRSIGLQMHSKLTALKAHINQMKLNEINLDEITHKINDPDCDQFERQRLVIQRSQIEDMRNWNLKLRDDLIHQLEVLYTNFKQFPRYTREQFEAAEKNHFEQLMHRKINGLEGAAEALINMTDDVPAFENFKQALSLVPPTELNTTLLSDLQQTTMTNKINILGKEKA